MSQGGAPHWGRGCEEAQSGRGSSGARQQAGAARPLPLSGRSQDGGWALSRGSLSHRGALGRSRTGANWADPQGATGLDETRGPREALGVSYMPVPPFALFPQVPQNQLSRVALCAQGSRSGTQAPAGPGRETSGARVCTDPSRCCLLSEPHFAYSLTRLHGRTAALETPIRSPDKGCCHPDSEPRSP